MVKVTFSSWDWPNERDRLGTVESFCLVPIDMLVVLLELITILCCSHHVAIEFRYAWRLMLLLVGSVPEVWIVVSSANISVEQWSTTNGRSLMNRRNRVGPSIDP